MILDFGFSTINKYINAIGTSKWKMTNYRYNFRRASGDSFGNLMNWIKDFYYRRRIHNVYSPNNYPEVLKTANDRVTALLKLFHTTNKLRKSMIDWEDAEEILADFASIATAPAMDMWGEKLP